MPIIQDDGEGAPKDEQAKSIEDKSRLIEEEELEMVVDEAPPVD